MEITFGEAMTALGLILAIFSAFGAWIWRLQGGIVAVRGELNDFRVKVAEEYASKKFIEQMEGRLTRSIEHLGEKIDRKQDK